MHVITKKVTEISVTIFFFFFSNNNHKYAWGIAQYPRVTRTHTHTQHYFVRYCFCVTRLGHILCYSTVMILICHAVFTFHTIGSLTIHTIRCGLSISLEVFLPINDLVHLVSSGTLWGHNWMIMTICPLVSLS
jgi:hypothetical protein